MLSSSKLASRVCSGITSLDVLFCAPDSLNVKRPLVGTLGELTASPNPSDLRGTNSVGVDGTIPKIRIKSFFIKYVLSDRY